MARTIDDTTRSRLYRAGYDVVELISSTSKTADLIKVRDQNGHTRAIKVFKGDSGNGMTAHHLRDLECLAMRELAPTKRVPEILYDSKVAAATAGVDEKTVFVVKPYYQTFLDRVLSDHPPLRLLEHAAQQADISAELLKHGWRDFDGSFMNDAFDEEGRLFRVDLDGAKPSSIINRKFHTKYQTEDDAELINRWINLHSEIFSNASEASSLAVRISRLMLNNEEVEWPALHAVTALRGGGGGNAPPRSPKAEPKAYRNVAGIKWYDRLGDWLLRYMPVRDDKPPQSVVPKADSGAAGGEEEKPPAGEAAEEKPEKPPETAPPKTAREAALADWIAAWRAGVAESGEMRWSSGKLREGEARLLALLTFHILSRKDHGFHVRDVYRSLMLLLLTILEDRERRITDAQNAELTDRDRTDFVRLVDKLHEVRVFLAQYAGAEAEGTSKAEQHPPAHSPELKATSFVCRGGMWPATSKGLDWKCQDFVLCSGAAEPVPFFLLADGASKANGDIAAQMASEIAQRNPRPERFNSLAEAREYLCGLVRQIHENISGLRRRSQNKGKHFETTLIVATVYNAPPAPVLLIIRYGNSGYLVTHEQAGEPQPWAGTSGYDAPPPDAVGSRSHKIFNPRDHLQEIELSQPGTWRVRAYSDGVGSEEEAWEMMGGTRSIEELTNEAKDWSSRYGRIGHDDWSIAGFDIAVADTANLPTIGSYHYEQAKAGKKRRAFPWPALARVPDDSLRLEREAREFWRSTLKTDPQVKAAEFPMLLRFINVAAPSPFARAKTSDAPRTDGAQPPPGEGEPSRSRSQATAPAWLTDPNLFAFAVLGVILIVIFYWWFGGGGVVEPPPPVTPVELGGTTPPGASPTPPLFNIPRQNEIYETLKAGKMYPVYGLATGSGVGEEPLRGFLTDLMTVLSRTGMAVTIDVHTDPSGSSSGNLTNTQNRKRAIEERLRGFKVTVVAMGDSTPPKNIPNPQTRDYRRLEIMPR